MQAHLVQLDMAWEQPETNFQRVEGLLAGADIRPGDLILLPEMFATGFSLNTETTADRGQTLAFLRDLARRRACFVQGGRTVLAEGAPKARNHMTTTGPDGSVVCEYAKIHPFSFGREPERFEGGEEVRTWAWTAGDASVTVCPAVCYDLRFPELFRCAVVRGTGVIALGACWPAARQPHWRALAISRAIENQSFMLAVNRTGDDPHLHYRGGSIAVSPTGEILGELDDREGVLTVTIDMAALRAWRQTFPAVKDIRLRQIR